MFRLFDRYILKEITPPFFIGLLIYTFVLLMNQILLLSELFIAKGVSFRVVLELLVFLIPSVLAFTVPMSVLMGILAGLSRLSSDAEITAFKTLGISYKRLLWPVMVFSFVGFLGTSFFTLYLAPRANYKWVQTLTQSVLTRIQFNIHSREFYEDIPNTVIFIQDTTPEMNWKNIFVYFSTPPEEPKVILAKQGRLNFYPEEKRAALELSEGTVHSYTLDDPEEYRITSFSHYEEELNVEGIVPTISEKRRVREKDIKELWQDSRVIKQDLQRFSSEQKEGLSYRQKKREAISHWVEIHKKFALPFACFIFALLGLPLGAFTKKGGRTSGFTLSIAIILVYYILITAGEQMAMKGRISPFVGMWGPNLLFFVVGLYFFIQSLRESPLLSFSFLLKRKGKDFTRERKRRISARFPRFSLPFPNILDRYIIRKFMVIFGFVFVSMLLVLAVVTFFDRLDSVYEHNKPLSDLLVFIWYKFPEFIQYIFPVTALTAALLCLGLLTKFNEVTAMKACGISLYRIIVPVLVLAGVVSFCSFCNQEYIQPYSNKKAEQVWNNITERSPRSYGYLDRRWVMSREKDRIYYYRYFDPIASAFSQISVFELESEYWSLKRRFFAEKGYLSQGNLGLSTAWIREFAGPRTMRFEKKKTMTLARVEDSNYFQKDWEEPDQMSYIELRKYIREIEERGFETVKFKVDLNFKITFPLASLIMALLGIPFAFTMGKRGTLVGVGLSMAIAMIYWGAIGVFKSFGYVNYLSPFLAAWGPALIFGSIGLYLISTLRT
ncbi:MAG: LPS export ABC transporter permease LptF [Candidatus Aminicenantes bacterium]|nr:LPS export ABC transporter permease LptF [Candidatus Aminicenantes bacterium]MDH5385560.1 LPS export ABC transporter permease LptF [Candidatus Aminicenantes bacterium]MDH5742745.1 LPS export ABC transporter permease LptF [Candidatus Aminicenantes bacterium]